MIPVLYPPNAADFSLFGLGVLTDPISCEVTEERNGVFECLLKYPVSDLHLLAHPRYRCAFFAVTDSSFFSVHSADQWRWHWRAEKIRLQGS